MSAPELTACCNADTTYSQAGVCPACGDATDSPTALDMADVERVLFDALDHYLDDLVVRMIEDADEQARDDADLVERLLRIYQARLGALSAEAA